MDTDLKRKMVSLDQLNSLLEFMKDHPDLAKGLIRGRRGKLMTLKVWNSCAKKLNAMPGAVKNGKGWSKYWCDWKYRVRRKALELKAAKEGDAPQDGLTPLLQIEETIMGVIGENTLDGVVIKSGPLTNGDLSAPDAVENDRLCDVPVGQFNTTSGAARKRRRSSSKELQELSRPSTPPEHKPTLGDDLETDESESEAEPKDVSAQFLRLEKEKLAHSRKLNESAQLIASELTRLTDAVTQIRDVIVNRFL